MRDRRLELCGQKLGLGDWELGLGDRYLTLCDWNLGISDWELRLSYWKLCLCDWELRRMRYWEVRWLYPSKHYLLGII